MPSLYEILGVDRGAGQDVIKKSYRALVLEKHPDKGGNAEEFKEIQRAYETLSDPQKRQRYDTTGQEGDAPQGGPMPFAEMMRGFGGGGFPGMPGQGAAFGFNVNDIFEQMFQGGMGGGQGGGMGGHSFFMGHGGPGGPGQGAPKPQRMGKGPSKQHEIGLSLAEFYKGRDIRLVFNQGRFCYACKGEGVTGYSECKGCGGKGVVFEQMQIQPGMFMQRRSTCGECGGQCRTAGPACTVCSGNKILNREKTLEVKITPGMRDGLQLQFQGECSDQAEYEKPGDVLLVLRRNDNLDYTWIGNDLAVEVKISWLESVIGFTRNFTDHPSAKPLTIVWNGEILTNGAKVKAVGQGMPKPDGTFGDLILTVMVKSPETGTDTKMLLMQALTDTKKEPATTDVVLVKC